MEWTFVSSSNIDSIAWEESGSLFVRFHNGRTYRYEDVPRDEFVNLCGASSVGSYFATYIKPRFVGIQV